ncbi:hypothetical protein FNF27_00719 [Cafeteria roenbergensis]|uniref:Uncharacterized protein n=1 Tax=Cafeteria roenbergensis TaxID=33653 RepID=A0A5A8EIX5_CAFRO|nr:hypothetical protein FNF27_00719 [Cafeteria roenbergensis]
MRALLLLAAGAAAASLRPSHAAGHLSPADGGRDSLEAQRFAAVTLFDGSEDDARDALVRHYESAAGKSPRDKIDEAFKDSSGGPNSFKVVAAADLKLTVDGATKTLGPHSTLCNRNVAPTENDLADRFRAACAPFKVGDMCGNVDISKNGRGVYNGAAEKLLGHDPRHFDGGRACSEIKNAILLVSDLLDAIKARPVKTLDAKLQNDAFKYLPSEVRDLGKACTNDPELALAEDPSDHAGSPLDQAQVAAGASKADRETLATKRDDLAKLETRGPLNKSKRRKREFKGQVEALQDEISALEGNIPKLERAATHACIVWKLRNEPGLVEHVNPCDHNDGSSCTVLGKEAAKPLAMFFTSLRRPSRRALVPVVKHVADATVSATVAFSSTADKVGEDPSVSSTVTGQWNVDTSKWVPV